MEQHEVETISSVLGLREYSTLPSFPRPLLFPLSFPLSPPSSTVPFDAELSIVRYKRQKRPVTYYGAEQQLDLVGDAHPKACHPKACHRPGPPIVEYRLS